MPCSRLSAHVTALKKRESVRYSFLALKYAQFGLRLHSTLVQTIALKYFSVIFLLFIILQLKVLSLMPLVEKNSSSNTKTTEMLESPNHGSLHFVCAFVCT